MAKKKQIKDKWKLFREFSADTGRYVNLLRISEKHNAVSATDGRRMFISRAEFKPALMLSKLFGIENQTLSITDSGELVKAETGEAPNADDIIDTAISIEEKHQRVRVEFPDWIGAISKKEKQPAIGFTLGEHPALVIAESSQETLWINAHYLEFLAGKTVDVLFGGTYSQPLVVVPTGQSVKNADWVALIMPMRNVYGVCTLIEKQKDPSNE